MGCCHYLSHINQIRFRLTAVSGTWKYDDLRLNMSNSGIRRTTVCHMFCRMTNMAAWEFFLQDSGVSESYPQDDGV